MSNNSIKGFLGLAFCIASVSGLSHEISIYCVDEAGAMTALRESGKKIILGGVYFEDGRYLVSTHDYKSVLERCCPVGGKKCSISGASYGSILGDKVSNYFPVEDLELFMLAKVNKHFQTLKDKYEVDLYEDDKTQHLRKFEDELPVFQGQIPLKDYLDTIFVVDFPRTNWVVKNERGRPIYSHWVATPSKELPKDVFKQVENTLTRLPDSIETKIGVNEVRNRIAIALATRSQTFDANIVDILHKHFSELMPGEIILYGNPESVNNSVTVFPTKLALESDGAILISRIIGASSVPAGLVRYHRSCEMNLLTGKLTKETIVIEKH